MIVITMPHVIHYNAKTPEKRAIWAKYSYFRADQDYADIARTIGLQGKNNAELVDALCNAIVDLAESVGVKMSLKDQGISKADVEKNADQLAELAYEDNCTITNPKEPLIADMAQIIRDEWAGPKSSF
ncbi:alcohol dehydrogenase [Agrilactobacillus composti DSM 18527 = JCM 14202]|nr:alcohol dehydrogenase [Agrilactobacillus composti DSM 18527 = JCM 14202]